MSTSEATVQKVLSLELVDSDWYAYSYRPAHGLSPLAHFLSEGWQNGLSPNPFFDAGWYLAHNPDIASTGVTPLGHYIEHGEAEGRWPCHLLDPGWYAQAHGLPLGGGAVLAHYLHQGSHQGLRPNACFDPEFYRDANPDLQRDLRRSTLHYLATGYREARPMSADFAGPWYRRTYLDDADIAPAHHYLTSGRALGFSRRPQEIESPTREVKRFAAPGAHFEEFDPAILQSGTAQAKVVTFYLPQFHAIPENDKWWGTGFTEWRNVSRGQPRFLGHHQPRIPRDLGFYDLTTPGVMKRQIELAKAAGVHGFCFYYYQFGRRKVMERPLEQLLQDKSLQMPFCLLWANENWTRRWDGQEEDILLRQDYAEADDEDFIASVATAMADARYIRAGGRPLLFVYRPGIIPDMRARVERWRRIFSEQHGLEPWLLMAQSFHDHDPTVYGLDGAVEFPPHKVTTGTPQITDRVQRLDPEFSGTVFDYADIVSRSLSDPEPSYPLIKTAFPSWDNDARRQGNGTTVAHSTPAAYQEWMEALIARARRKRFAGEAFVFVNAWNEWAEGAYLEPDVHFGSAYLNATARAVVGSRALTQATRSQVLLVGHDAHEHGAQMLLLNLGRTLARRFGIKVTFLLFDGGALTQQYQEIGEVLIARPTAPDLPATISDLRRRGIAHAITNTVVSGAVVPLLRHEDIQVLSLVHELPRLIREFHVEEASRAIASQSDTVVFPARFVRDRFVDAIEPVAHREEILPQGLYAEIAPDPDARWSVRSELGLPADARIVLGIGYGDLRKGIDLFFETARRAMAAGDNLSFVWIGRLEAAAATWILETGDAACQANIRHVPFTPAIGRYLQAADVFYLTSREDPFPSTVLEALSCGLPAVGFAGRTGSEDLIRSHGTVVPAYDTQAALAALLDLTASGDEATASQRRDAVLSQFRWDDYAFGLVSGVHGRLPRISVVVPTYNYARYLEGRLDSIFRQTIPVFEIIVLDDASSDDSLAVVERVAQDRKRDIRIVRNEANSGSVFRQWTKAVREARGDLVWIAEADDLAEPTFLERLSALFDADTAMAFSDSVQIDAEGEKLAESYDYYFKRFDESAFGSSFSMAGDAFAKAYLSRANVILNVSSALFRREALLGILESELDNLASYRFAGDWVAYLNLCRAGGKVAFLAESLNHHRRHGGSATHATALAAHVAEVERVHDAYAALFDRSASIRSAQDGYVAELREQFGLPAKGEEGTPSNATEMAGAAQLDATTDVETVHRRNT